MQNYACVYRKIFGYRWFESATDLQLSLGCPTWILLIEQMKVSFYERLALSKADLPVHILLLIQFMIVFIVLRNFLRYCANKTSKKYEGHGLNVNYW